MLRYLIKQTSLSLVKLFLFLTLMFFLVQIVIPWDFVDQFSMFCRAECQAEMRAQLGLDAPLFERYLTWLGDILRGDLGRSFRVESVSDLLQQYLPPTILVFLTGTLIAFVLGLLLGRAAAWRGRGFFAGTTTFASIAFFTSFPPWLAWLVAYAIQRVGFVERGIGFNLSQFPHLSPELWAESGFEPHVIATRMILTILGFSLLVPLLSRFIQQRTRYKVPAIVQAVLIGVLIVASWYLWGIDVLAFNMLNAAGLAILTYVLLAFGETMLIMRASMTEVLHEEYVTTAKAKGLPGNVVRDKHAARNALLPVLSRLVISLPYLLTGIVIIENAVNWPGIGANLVGALAWLDMPLVMAVMVIVGVLSLLARLALDMLTAYLDPRIRFGQAANP